MLRNRMLIVLGGCLLATSAAWADGVAYVDCSGHPESTPVFGKPRRTPETVASLPCGERFTILLNGFIFSRIQTKDGTVGYVYSNLLSFDRSGTVVQQPASTPPTAAARVFAGLRDVLKSREDVMKSKLVVCALALLALFAGSARAQEDRSKVDIFAGYSYLRFNPSTSGVNS